MTKVVIGTRDEGKFGFECESFFLTPFNTIPNFIECKVFGLTAGVAPSILNPECIAYIITMDENDPGYDEILN